MSQPWAQALGSGDQILAVAPPVVNLTQLTAPFVFGRRPWVIGRPEAPRRGVIEDESAGPLRIGRSEQHRDPRSLLGRPEDRTLRVNCVHHGTDVVHPRLQRRHLPYRIREAASALVEEDGPGRLGEPLDVINEEGHIPSREQIGERAAHEDDVRVALPDDLVGDRNVAASRVVNVGDLHDESVPLDWRRGYDRDREAVVDRWRVGRDRRVARCALALLG